MTDGAKYAKVLEIRRKKTYKAEDEIGFGRNTLANAIRDDRRLSEEYHTRFINHFGVNPVWFETEEGEIFKENITSVQNRTDNTGKPLGAQEMLKMLQDVLAEGSDYRIIPNRIIEGNYLEIENRARELDARAKELAYIKDAQAETIATKNQLIKRLEDEIAELRSKPVTSQGAQ